MNDVRTVETYGEFTQREAAIITAFEQATGPLYEALDCADTGEAYALLSRNYGVVQTLDACRRNRHFLANVGACVEVLRERLRDGGAELSIAAAMYLDAQTGTYETKRTGIERCLLDALLGPVAL